LFIDTSYLRVSIHSFFLQSLAHHRTLHSFPTRRSSDLHLALGPTLLGGPGYRPPEHGNRGPRYRTRGSSLFPAEHQRRTGERDRSSHPGKRGQHGLGMCASGERRNLHLVATIRGVVPAKVGEVAASQGREVGAAPLAGPHLGATFDLVPA